MGMDRIALPATSAVTHATQPTVFTVLILLQQLHNPIPVTVSVFLATMNITTPAICAIIAVLLAIQPTA
jgi:hypothetical protein